MMMTRSALATACFLGLSTLALPDANTRAATVTRQAPSDARGSDGGAVIGSKKASEPFTDYRLQRAGTVHHIQVGDLPRPLDTPSVDNGPRLVARPNGAWPRVPTGFTVQQYADGLDRPRLIRTAPNGDIFVAESKAGSIRVLRGRDERGHAAVISRFASGLNRPFGVAFYPPTGTPRWVYIANTDSVVRISYQTGDLTARARPEIVVPALPGGGLLRGGGHWTRDVVFSLDGKRMFVSVGSRSNNDDVDDNPAESRRADILEFNPAGGEPKVFATGIRNAVGLAIHPRTGALWASVNERDELGDNLVPDYITHVVEGGFYGWPWFYIGPHADPRHVGKHVDLQDKVLVPDVLLQPHNASLQLEFYEGRQFPVEYRGDIFAAQHGSWNRSVRTGYEVIRVAMDKNGQARGDYQDFLTGFVTAGGDVWGRPVGVTVAGDGALLVSDDVSNVVWRIAYQDPGQ